VQFAGKLPATAACEAGKVRPDIPVRFDFVEGCSAVSHVRAAERLPDQALGASVQFFMCQILHIFVTPGHGLFPWAGQQKTRNAGERAGF
jgi:hypothetical protein